MTSVDVATGFFLAKVRAFSSLSARIIKAPILFAPLIVMSEVNVRYSAAIVLLFWFIRFHSYLSFESGLMLVGDQGQGRLLLGWRRCPYSLVSPRVSAESLH